MLFRKFTSTLEEFLLTEPDKILLVNGARQVGKSYLISYVSKKLFKNYVEINLKEDKEGDGIFAGVRSTDDFYLQLGAIAGDRLGERENTIVFLDEIQAYPHLLTMLKFLNQERRYRYIASGSQLGVALAETPSVPLGSVAIKEMYPLDFEEFLISQGCGQETIDAMEAKFKAGEPLNEALHTYMMRQFRLYLLVGGLPDAVKTFNESR
ncbi:MAG: AAA family ATPase, partial [Bacteroidales bacterium]|nr:AAA family ATPase [Bacteroidales bacterium]